MDEERPYRVETASSIWTRALAKHYLIPKGLAIQPTDGNIKRLEQVLDGLYDLAIGNAAREEEIRGFLESHAKGVAKVKEVEKGE